MMQALFYDKQSAKALPGKSTKKKMKDWHTKILVIRIYRAWEKVRETIRNNNHRQPFRGSPLSGYFFV